MRDDRLWFASQVLGNTQLRKDSIWPTGGHLRHWKQPDRLVLTMAIHDTVLAQQLPQQGRSAVWLNARQTKSI